MRKILRSFFLLALVSMCVLAAQATDACTEHHNLEKEKIKKKAQDCQARVKAEHPEADSVPKRAAWEKCKSEWEADLKGLAENYRQCNSSSNRNEKTIKEAEERRIREERINEIIQICETEEADRFLSDRCKYDENMERCINSSYGELQQFIRSCIQNGLAREGIEDTN